MESLLGLTWKLNYQNIPWALRFNCNLHKTEPPFACFESTPGNCIWCPSVFIECKRAEDRCLVGTFPGAPLRLHHLHWWSPLPAEGSFSVHLSLGAPSHWHSSAVKPLDTTGELQSCCGCSSWVEVLGHLSLSLPLDALVCTLAPFSPTLVCPCLLPALPTALLGSWEKAWKTWSGNAMCLQLKSICKIFTDYLSSWQALWGITYQQAVSQLFWEGRKCNYPHLTSAEAGT